MSEEQGKRQRRSMATREKMREAGLKKWQDPEYRRRRREAHQDPERLRRKREAMRRLWQDHEWRQRQIAAQREARLKPEYTRRLSEGVRKAWQDPERARRWCEAIRKAWQDPERQERCKKNFKRYHDRAALGRLIAEEAALGPMDYSEFAALAELFLNETEKKS